MRKHNHIVELIITTLHRGTFKCVTETKLKEMLRHIHSMGALTKFI